MGRLFCSSPNIWRHYEKNDFLCDGFVICFDHGLRLHVGQRACHDEGWHDKDVAASGKSVCNGDCAVKWPPMMAASTDKATGDWAVITRDNGQKQWAYKGKPLYTWPEDQEPGDKYGDNYNKVWHIVK
jgi:hypothetical protein